MTEAEWLACANPRPMLCHVLNSASPRKRRVFGCACCYRVWAGWNASLKENLETVERYANGEATDEDLAGAARVSQQWANEMYNRYRQLLDMPDEQSADEIERVFAASQAGYAVNAAAELWENEYPSVSTYVTNYACFSAFGHLIPEGGLNRDDPYEVFRLAEQKSHADLLRDIFGNPFRPVTFSPSWRTDTALTLARQMYDSRDFSAMPILADALQDAGCDNDDILAHCRGDGPHVRGCWVVDLVLGKE